MRAKLIGGCVLVLGVLVVCWVWIRSGKPLEPARSKTDGDVAPGSQLVRSISGPAAAASSSIMDRPPPSSFVQTILNSQKDYLERVAAVSSLATNLNASEWEALREFLLRVDPKDGDPYGQAVKNRLLDKLCAMNLPPAGLGETLIGMYRDRGQDEVIRDYAIQHLAVYDYQLNLCHVDDPEIQRKVREVLREALAEINGSIAGTALLALMRLSEEHPEIEAKFVASEALTLASDERTGELSRITAFQICGRMGVRDARVLLQDAAEHGGSVVLRISAIGALGCLGDPEARPVLSALTNGVETRLRMPAQLALEQITNRERDSAASN